MARQVSIHFSLSCLIIYNGVSKSVSVKLIGLNGGLIYNCFLCDEISSLNESYWGIGNLFNHCFVVMVMEF